MTGSTSQPKAEKPLVRLWPYAVSGAFLLVVFMTGIIVPDYFNYQIRLAKIEAVSKISAAATKSSTAQTDSKSIVDNLTSPSLEVKSSEIFETYGKLLTMLLGLVSVLGVFFGYFVRKSLREVEEDLRGHVQQSMEFWGKERDRLSNEVSEKLREIAEQRRQQEKLSQDFEKTVERSKQVLETLEVAAKAEQQKLTGDIARTATAAAKIDADETIPKPEGT
jgi:hypothetical protein